MSDNGFLYYHAGGKHAVKLLVSIASVRRVGHDEPIHIACSDDKGEEYARKIAAEPRLGPITVARVQLETAGKAKGKGRQHCGKSSMGSWTPFGKTIYLDADTVAAAKLDGLWPRSEEVILTNFAQWWTTGGMMKRRLNKYRPVLPAKVAAVTGTRYPAVNTGIMAWDRFTEHFHRTWKRYCTQTVVSEDGQTFMADDENLGRRQRRKLAKASTIFMGDEIVANLIFIDYRHRIFDDRWNFSPVFSVESRGGKFDPADVKVWHYHGEKHTRAGPAIESWGPAYKYCVDENFANITSWQPADDSSLALALREKRL